MKSITRPGFTLLLIALAGCAHSRTADPAPPSPISDLPALRVGIARTVPPIMFEQAGRPAGIEADLAQRLGAALGFEIEYVPTYFPNLLFELNEKHIDIVMAGMTITKSRQKKAAFTEPYLTIGQQVLTRRDTSARLATRDAIRRTTLTVGVESGSTAEQFVTREIRGAAREAFPTVAAAIESLLEGGIDLIVHDGPTVHWFAAQHAADGLVAIPHNLTEEHLGWAVHRENRELLDQVNAVLQRWKADGTLESVLRRWIP